MMQKEEAITLMVLPLLLAVLLGVVGRIGADMLIVGFVLIGLGVAGMVGSVILLARARFESGFVLVLGFIVAAVGSLTAIAASSL